jgi:ABC-type polysaccharide/polyol phosphate export permease
LNLLKYMLASIKIGIDHDLSWTNPALSILLRTASPFASIMTSSLIYTVGTSAAHSFTDEGLMYVMVGAFMYIHFASYAWVPTLAIGEGKNLFVFQYITITKGSSSFYLAGRTMSSFTVSLLTCSLSFLLSYLSISFLIGHYPTIILSFQSILLMLAIFVLNLPSSLGLGFLLASYALYASKFEWALPSYVAGLLMITSGALFPVNLLPYPISYISTYLPFTEFIRAARDILLYSKINDFLYSTAEGFVGGILLFLFGYITYLYSEKRARKTGALDRRLA